MLIVVLVILVWSNSFSVPFVLDDHSSIVTNTTIRDLWSLQWLRPPATIGETVSGRPLLNFSFALNYAIGALDVRGYHAVNILIHALSALTLYGLVRRTLVASRDPNQIKSAQPSTGPSIDSLAQTPRAAVWFSLSVALLWALHPLHTGAVTYVVQRAESLAGFFYLFSLYAFVRSAERDAPTTRWSALCVASCLLGMATKETVVTAPVIILLYDRTFVAGTFRSAWRARHRLYLALAASWLLLVALVVTNSGRGGSAGFASAVSTWTYFLTQCEAIPRYLWLSFWPASQVFDYGTSTAPDLASVLPQLLFLCALAIATCWALYHNRPAGFLGACFFLLLAPSSSFIPVATQTIAEHRMYLPLAAVVLLVTLAGRKAVQRFGLRFLGFALVPLLALGLSAATFARNQTYRSPLALWEETAARRPDNPRAHNNLGLALSAAGRTSDAIAAFERALELQPNHAFAHFNLGTVLLIQRQFTDAQVHFESALAADPKYVSARLNLGRTLTEIGQNAEAIAHYRIALNDDPSAHDVRTNLAALLIKNGDIQEAESMLRDVLSAQPDLAEAHYHFGLLREKSGDLAAAEAAFRQAILLQPKLAPAHLALGNTLMRRGQSRDAAVSYREASRLDPQSADAHYALGNSFAKEKRFAEAIHAYREALAIDPAHLPALANLANCQLVTGHFFDAVTTYEAVLRAKPDDAAVQQNLELAREMIRKARP